jgi:hypothetical protein
MPKYIFIHQKYYFFKKKIFPIFRSEKNYEFYESGVLIWNSSYGIQK